MRDELLKHSLILMAFSAIGGGLGYAYQIVTGRLLGPEEYGAFGSLVAIVYTFMVVEQSFEITTAKYLKYYRYILKRALQISTLIVLVMVLLSPVISSILKIDILVILALLPYFFFSLPNTVNIGAFKGLERYITLGLIDTLRQVVKFVTGVALIILGFGVYGAVFGFSVATTFMFLLSLFVLLRCLYSVDTKTASIHSYTLHSVVLAFCMSMPTNLDVLFARSMFTAYESGIYTSASVFGKIQFFVAYSIVWALFPKVTKLKSSERLLMKATLYVICVSGLLALVYLIFPSEIIEFLFGKAYLSAVPLLEAYGFAMLLFSILTVIISYHMAKGEVHVVYIFLIATLVEFIGFTQCTKPLDLVRIIFYGNAIGLVLWLLFILFSRSV